MNEVTPVTRILHVEDNANDAELIGDLLRKGGVACSMQRVYNRVAFAETVAREPFDLILCDFSLPGFNGLDALEIAKAKAPETPFVFVSGMIGEELAVESLKRGAADYIIKDRLARLPAAIKRALADAHSRREQHLARRHMEEQALLLQHASDLILVCSPELRVTFANARAQQFYGRNMLGEQLDDVFEVANPPTSDIWAELLSKSSWSGTVRRTIGGLERILQSRWTLLRSENGEVLKALISETDVTDEKLLENGLVRAQRLESIGTLAAGVAHDVNNSLAPIVMGLDLLTATTETPENARLLEIMRHSAEHCAHLVGQIVTFARGATETRGAVPIGPLLKEVTNILGQVFPKSIQIHQNIPSDLRSVMGDATRLHQAIMNLCINARDAMLSGGALTINACNLDEPNGEESASFVRIEIHDTGAGISPDHAQKIFEPFFTTKAETGGTGLGLALVHKIMKEHRGQIRFESAPGAGTRFFLTLPATRHSGASSTCPAEPVQAPGKGQTILIVEDELSLAEMMSRALADAGYRTLIAHDGAAGLAIWFQHQYNIDLIVTDYSMPYLNGARMLAIIQGVQPNVPAILSTGLIESATPEILPRHRVKQIINKPFTADHLLRAVAEALETQPSRV